VLELEAETVTEFDYAGPHQFLRTCSSRCTRPRASAWPRRRSAFPEDLLIDVSNGQRPEDKLVLFNPTIVKVEGKQVAKKAAQRSRFPRAGGAAPSASPSRAEFEERAV